MGVKDLRAKNSKPELGTWAQPASGLNSALFVRRVAKKPWLSARVFSSD